MTDFAKPTFYEFFAGGGMARAGIGDGWQCVFSNDFDFKKGAVYQTNWDKGRQTVLKVCDIRKVDTSELPGIADLAWASFPCQDLSLAGGGAGLRGERSGTFYPFWDVKLLIAEGRAPRVVALENVTGTLTSHGGKDFEAICQTFAENGYRYGALVTGGFPRQLLGEFYALRSQATLVNSKTCPKRAAAAMSPRLSASRTSSSLSMSSWER